VIIKFAVKRDSKNMTILLIIIIIIITAKFEAQSQSQYGTPGCE